MVSVVQLLLVTVPVTIAYIVPSGLEPACLSVHCLNGGSVVESTCQCTCADGYTGLLCETDLGHSGWPAGEYGLPMSQFGCPGEDRFGWNHGYVNLTLPTSSREQFWNDEDYMTFEPHIMGPFHTHVMQLNFCLMRKFSVDREMDDLWPPGQYCLYKVGDSCPDGGFTEGSMTIHGYTFDEADLGGDLPTLNYSVGHDDVYVGIHFCCKGDGDAQNPVVLPNAFPFILLKGSSSSGCQSVQDMDVKEEVFYMTNQAAAWEFSGNHSNVAKGGKHIGILYCYYTPQARRECYFENDLGASYHGRDNTTVSGSPCMRWLDMPFDYFVNKNTAYFETEENYCRTVDRTPHEGQPICYIDLEWNRETCGIQKCEEDPDVEIIKARKPVYTSAYTESMYPFYATDGTFGTSFQSFRPQHKPFLQVDLQQWYQVHAILVYRTKTWFPINIRQVGTFVSKFQWDFLDYGAFRCDDIRFPSTHQIFRFQCRRPIIGRYVTVRNFDSTDPVVNMGKYHCMEISEIMVLGKRTWCGQHMGMLSGDIFDFQISSSSNIKDEITSDDGRLILPGLGWCPSDGDIAPWFMVDFLLPTVIQGLRIQGWNEGKTRKLVKEFTVHYGNEFSKLSAYHDPAGIVKTFKTFDHYESSAVQDYVLTNAILARFFKIETRGVQNDACLKMEVIGCTNKRVLRDIRCRPGSMDFGFAELQFHSLWIPSMVVLEETDLLGCRQYLLDRAQVSYSYDNTTRMCLVSTGHRYDRELYSSFITDRLSISFMGERLCIQDVVDMSYCGGNVTLPAGNDVIKVYSPSFPFSYGQNINCVWAILAAPGKYVRLEIVYISLAKEVKWNDVTDAGDAAEGVVVCSDTVTIYEDESDPIAISHVHGRSVDIFMESTVISTSSTLYLRLMSCSLYKKSQERNVEVHVQQSDVPGCGLSSGQCLVTCAYPAAYIGTPGYPSDISLLDTCSWRIEGTFGIFVRLEILHLDIVDEKESCVSTFLAVYDVQLDGKLSLIRKSCRTDRGHRMLVSSWHHMQIDFRTGNGHGKGFLGKYELVDFTQANFNVTSEGCLQNWTKLGASCYSLHNEGQQADDGNAHGLTWVKARDRCNTMGGHLASITSKDEMTFIHYLMTKIWGDIANGEAYIGLQKLLTDEDIEYRWLDGSPMTYTAWYKDAITKKSQPDGLNSERCSVIRMGSIHTLDNWHDIACAYDGIPSFICEMDSHNKTQDTTRTMLTGGISAEFSSHYPVYNCTNGVLISRTFTCNGQDNCGDNSDEMDCDSENGDCLVNQYRCDNGDCISLSHFCDFLPHCQDKSDESVCVYPPCQEGQRRCGNGQCISNEAFCDLKEDCFDGSDEDICGDIMTGDTCGAGDAHSSGTPDLTFGFCEDTCRQPNFLCYDQTCIRGTRRCDGTIDCSGLLYEDENQQCETNVPSSCWALLGLGVTEDGEYLIKLGSDAPVNVECQFGPMTDGKTSIKTIIHHDNEEPVTSRKVHVLKNMAYSISMSHIDNLKRNNRCHQDIRIACHTNPNINFGWHGIDTEWHVALLHGTSNGTCSCPMLDKCEAPLDRCNCTTTYTDWYETGINDIREDHGVIYNHDVLPILHFEMEPVGGTYGWLTFTFGPLVCEYDEYATSQSFLCRSGVSIDNIHLCILDYDAYGEIQGCSDLSHLDTCANFECPADHNKCPDSYCIPVRLVCDGISHCPYGEDEISCDRICTGLFSCHNSDVCISQLQVCDGVQHCLEGDDEGLCGLQCPVGCTCDDMTITCLEASFYSNDTFTTFTGVRKLSIRNSYFSGGLPVLIQAFLLLAELDLSRNEITTLTPNIFRNLSNLYSLDLSYNSLTGLDANVFSSLQNLVYLNLEGNHHLVIIRTEAFLGLEKLPTLVIQETQLASLVSHTFVGLIKIEVLNLSSNLLYEVEDDAFSTLSDLTVLDIRGNQISQFSEGIFNGLTNLRKLYTDAYMFCCLKPSTVTDDNCLPYQNEFSSCADLMREDHLRAFMWIIGTCALIGNAGVIIYRIVVDRRSLQKAHGIFIMNLGVADFLMGIYMLIIAVADTIFRGRYIWNDLFWRSSITCKLAGFLATFSSEASVFFLLLITIDRFVSIRFLFGQHSFSRRRAILCSLVAWVVCGAIALVPLLPIPYFKGQFYSRSAVCLALPLTRDRPAGWEYGTTIFIFMNFIIFISIAVGQVLIYKEISSVDNIIKSQRRVQDAAIARSLFLVVFSDFLCWFPLGVMGLMSLSGHRVSSEVYAWVAVFILPINSALNPILYTYSGIIRQKRNAQVMQKMFASGGSISFATQYAKWSDICDSDQFVIGASLSHMTLRVCMKERTPTVRRLYKIVLDLIRNLQFLHDRNLHHGCVDWEHVIVTNTPGMAIRAYSKVKPSIIESIVNSGSDDMENLGKLTIKLLRWYQISRQQEKR